jgi:molybdate transport system substrate-binding protein
VTVTARRLLATTALVAVFATVLAGGVGAKPSRTAASGLTVFAAASLTDVFPKIDPKEIYNFGGSNALAIQIRNGAPADVFASANTEIPSQLYKEGVILKPVNFTRNKLVVIVPRANPAGIASMYDLTKPNVKIDVASPAVPVGAYTLQVLKQMGLTTRVLTNVVSQDEDVRSVLARVALGQADAGFVYATDARTVPDDVKVIKVPAWAQPKVVYSMAVVARSSNRAAAQAYIKKILGTAAQATLAKYGFLPPPVVRAKSAIRYQLATGS